MINTVTIVGNLGQDPEIRYTPSGVPVANFTVAVNEIYTNKDGRKGKKVHWFKVTAFKVGLPTRSLRRLHAFIISDCPDNDQTGVQYTYIC